MIPRLKTLYEKDIINNLMTKLNYKNKNQAPKIIKIVLNMGLGEDASDGKKIKTSLDDLSLITGQKQLSQNLKNQFQILKQEKDRALALK